MKTFALIALLTAMPVSAGTHKNLYPYMDNDVIAYCSYWVTVGGKYYCIEW